MNAISKDAVLTFIGEMSLREMAEFVRQLEERLGVEATVPRALIIEPDDTRKKVVAQTEFDALLTHCGPRRIPVIKAIRELLGIGLKEAKMMSDNLPALLLSGVPRDQAEEIREKLEDVGATIEIR